jgi:DNA-binding transcriptional ArsR family regulator
MRTGPSRITGPGAAARKYDLLTALAVAGLRESVIPAVLALRLIALITARYDWMRDAVSIGHDELARLWGVSLRTVARDLDRLRRMGLLQVTAPARRGRVAVYRLDHTALDHMLRPVMPTLPPGQAARLRAEYEGSNAPEPEVSPNETNSGWWAIRATLDGRLPAAALTRWIDELRCEDTADGVLRLRAPSSFHADYATRTYGDALRRAAIAVNPELRRVEIGV